MMKVKDESREMMMFSPSREDWVSVALQTQEEKNCKIPHKEKKLQSLKILKTSVVVLEVFSHSVI